MKKVSIAAALSAVVLGLGLPAQAGMSEEAQPNGASLASYYYGETADFSPLNPPEPSCQTQDTLGYIQTQACAGLNRACGAGHKPSICCGGDMIQCFKSFCKRKGLVEHACGNQHPMCAPGLFCRNGRCAPVG